jgi:hypothetical protein
MFTTARRGLVAAVTAAIACLAFTASALADAPDVKVPPNQVPNVSASVAATPQPGFPDAVTVTVTGSWSWPTHGGDCNLDRAGAGVAIDWFDPHDPGNRLKGKGKNDPDPTVDVGGSQTTIDVGDTGANGLNAADNVVHPTENDTDSGAVSDIADPSDFANWHGGCGVFSSDTLLDGSTATVAHGNFGRLAPGAKDSDGHPFDDPTAPAGASQQGAVLKHTYQSSSDLSHVCAVTYDVHNGTKAKDGNGVGTPGSAGEVTAGGSDGNHDNGVVDNANTPLGNACPTAKLIKPPPPPAPTTLTTNAGGPFTLTASGLDIADTATIAGGTADGGGTITFTLFHDNGAGGCGTPAAAPVTAAVTHGANGQSYSSPAVHVTSAGQYHWTASYSGDSKNAGSASACGAANENPTVAEQQVLGTRSTPGTAHLAGVSGCVSRSFFASVKGKHIKKVAFSIDGHKRKTVKKADAKGRYKFKVNPRKFKPGSHLLVARASFTTASNTKAKTMRLRFARCIKRVAPAFTG